MSKTPSSTLNSRIRGKKVKFLSDDDEKLITRALSFVWIKTNKKIEACNFDQEKVKVSYKKNEGRVYFDLDESLSSFTFINKVTTLSTCSLCFVSFLNTIFFHFWTTLSTFSLYFVSFSGQFIFFVSGQFCPLFPCISFLFLDAPFLDNFVHFSLYFVSFSGRFCLLHFFSFLDNFVHFFIS
jgi:hypothetical protein